MTSPYVVIWVWLNVASCCDGVFSVVFDGVCHFKVQTHLELPWSAKMNAFLSTAAEDDAVDGDETVRQRTSTLDHEHESYNQFMGFVGSHKLDSLSGRAGVMVLGLSRTGKSSIILVQRGSHLVWDQDKGELKPIHQDGDPRVSNAIMSRTLHIGIYQDTRRERIFFDTAGIDENRAPTFESWTYFSLFTCLGVISELQATVVVINWQTTFANGASATTLRTLTSKINQLVGSGTSEEAEKFYDSMCFVFTFINRRQANLMELMLNRVCPHYVEELKLLRDQLRGLHQQFPRRHNRMTEAAHRIQGIFKQDYVPTIAVGTDFEQQIREVKNQINELEKKIDMTKWYESQDKHTEDANQAFFEAIRASIQFLETLLKGPPDRVVLSFPISSKANEHQRNQLEVAIRSRPPIDRKRLRAMIAKRSTNSEVYAQISRMALQHQPRVKKYIECLERVLRNVREHEDMLRSIQRSWESVRREQLGEVRKRIKKIEAQKRDTRDTIRRLRNSTTMVMVKEYYVNKHVKSPWYFLGMDFVVDVLEHRGSYDKPDFEDATDPHVSLARHIVLRKEKNYAKFKLISKWNRSLVTTVKFMIEERRHPDTKTKITSEEDHLRTLDRDLERELRLERHLQSAADAGELTFYLVTRSMNDDILKYQDACHDLQEEFDTQLRDPETQQAIFVTRSNVIAGITSLFDLVTLHHDQPIFPGADADAARISDFIESVQRMRSLDDVKNHNSEYKQLKPTDCTGPDVSVSWWFSRACEDTVNIGDTYQKSHNSQIKRLVLRAQYEISKLSNDLTTNATSRPLPYLLPVSGFLLFRGMSFNWYLCFALYFFLLAVVLAVLRAFHDLLMRLNNTTRFMEKCADDLRAAIARGAEETGYAWHDAVTKIADNVDRCVEQNKRRDEEVKKKDKIAVLLTVIGSVCVAFL